MIVVSFPGSLSLCNVNVDSRFRLEFPNIGCSKRHPPTTAMPRRRPTNIQKLADCSSGPDQRAAGSTRTSDLEPNNFGRSLLTRSRVLRNTHSIATEISVVPSTPKAKSAQVSLHTPSEFVRLGQAMRLGRKLSTYESFSKIKGPLVLPRVSLV